MAKDEDRTVIEQRAKRLKLARTRTRPKISQAMAAEAMGISRNTYKAHEAGQNGFELSNARAYARFYKVSAVWLFMGVGKPDDGPVANPRLQGIFEQLQKAPGDIQALVISYAEFALAEQSRETATSPAP